MAQKLKGGGTRKYGRNLAWCKSYRLRNQRERNKIRRLQKRLLKFPNDKSAAAALVRCREVLRVGALREAA